MDIYSLFPLYQRLQHDSEQLNRMKDKIYKKGIVRPVKRDWAVLSKDTPLDISI